MNNLLLLRDMRPIILMLSLMLVSMKLFAQPNTNEIEVYNRSGERVSLEAVLKATEDKKYVFFGELHGNPLAHEVEFILLQHLHKVHGKKLILGMEMFETDVQHILDEYFSGIINQRSFETEARVWNNYQKDYKPLVEYARENGLQVVASNVPRRYANTVYHQGVDALNRVKKSEKKWMVKLPFKIDWELESYKSMASMLPDHSAQNFIASQALKDATMGEWISRYMKKKGQVMFHVHGAYHSTNGEGIVPYIKGLKSNELILLTTIQKQADKALSKEDFQTADYTFVSP
jgi:uncharacterized iron-regulated protein